MLGNWREDHLPGLVAALVSRPGHNNVRTLIGELLHHAFGADYLAIDQEVRLPEVHGRADTLFGSVVFEFKGNLQRELGDVYARLPDYLTARERQTGRRFVEIATDGAEFIAYELRGDTFVEIGRHATNRSDPGALLAWLEPALANRDDLTPDPLTVERELGRSSLSFGRARGVLERLWNELRAHSEVFLKRQLWDGLLREAYGTAVGDDALFLQHTYLTIVAKTIAARVLDLPANDAAAILSGRALDDEGIQSAARAMREPAFGSSAAALRCACRWPRSCASRTRHAPLPPPRGVHRPAPIRGSSRSAKGSGRVRRYRPRPANWPYNTVAVPPQPCLC
jgi:hypothetical protein